MSTIFQNVDFVKEISTNKLFDNHNAVVTSIQIKAGGRLKEHSSPKNAFLYCASGKVGFENEFQEVIELEQGSFIEIQQLVKHSVLGIEDSILLLCR